MDLLVLLLVLGAIVAVVVVSKRNAQTRELERKRAELEPVKKFAFEDITALGTELQDLDLELSGRELDAGSNADYQRALDAYEAAKTAGDAIQQPEDLKHVAEILEDGYVRRCGSHEFVWATLRDTPLIALLDQDVRDAIQRESADVSNQA